MHVLASTPDQFAEQLHGRLKPGASEVLDRFIGELTRIEPRPRLHGRWRTWRDCQTSLLQVLTGHEGWVYGAQVLPDERVLSWSDDSTLRVWDLGSGSAQVLTGHESGGPRRAALRWAACCRGVVTARCASGTSGGAAHRSLTGHERRGPRRACPAGRARAVVGW